MPEGLSAILFSGLPFYFLVCSLVALLTSNGWSRPCRAASPATRPPSSGAPKGGMSLTIRSAIGVSWHPFIRVHGKQSSGVVGRAHRVTAGVFGFHCKRLRLRL